MNVRLLNFKILEKGDVRAYCDVLLDGMLIIKGFHLIAVYNFQKYSELNIRSPKMVQFGEKPTDVIEFFGPTFKNTLTDLMAREYKSYLNTRYGKTVKIEVIK